MPNQLLQFVPGHEALHRMPFSLRCKGTAEQKCYPQHYSGQLSLSSAD